MVAGITYLREEGWDEWDCRLSQMHRKEDVISWP